MVPHHPHDPDAVRNNAEHLMNALGRTAEDVATALMLASVPGEPEHPGRCPIARYLLDRDARLTGVAVGSDMAHLDLPGGTMCATVPFAVTTFINLFDHGHYPGLIASSLPNPLAGPGTTDGTE
ncbi:hypothetical protein [Actinoplanes regularis]|uniref:hypothetical protein n=1 Tax=Actinoplanes regularis TaxID=52697 RepID=UPI0024A07C10|nr:hypothetical protein [Actinoplanes regularis]GLW30161.1 hypothetical protein Areg01_31010 [Actinoplanes regularis]